MFRTIPVVSRYDPVESDDTPGRVTVGSSNQPYMHGSHAPRTVVSRAIRGVHVA